MMQSGGLPTGMLDLESDDEDGKSDDGDDEAADEKDKVQPDKPRRCSSAQAGAKSVGVLPIKIAKHMTGAFFVLWNASCIQKPSAVPKCIRPQGGAPHMTFFAVQDLALICARHCLS